MHNNEIQIDEMQKEKAKLVKIIEENRDAHEKYIDPNYIGDLSPVIDPYKVTPKDSNNSIYNIMDSFIMSELEKKRIHEQAVMNLGGNHITFLTASEKLSKLENKIEKLNNQIKNEAINNLTSRAWIIRNSINGIRIGVIALFLIAIFFKLRKPGKTVEV